ncbi:MAG TPA: zinc-dependent metalloprotease family protein [Verrucomicrobiae bacterium]|nr:zinc-dependent metalloprotease family protein [Verrucomicrobiae bacterium]
MMCRYRGISLASRSAFLAFWSLFIFIQASPEGWAAPREFRPGALSQVRELPRGRLQERLNRLPPQARARALGWLRNFHFTEADVDSLHADAEGAIYYVDHFPGAASTALQAAEPVTSEAAVPVSPFPPNLQLHSRPGAPNVIYLNFSGESISNTAWNSSTGRSVIEALPFSSDSDYSTFSDSEQAAIRKVWQRVSEDFAPFNVDVTTERPPAFTSRTAMALITRSSDATGGANPSAGAGGIAYVNVFASGNYNTFRPAFVYHDNLGHSEAHIAEAASHEVGHNMGLSHDGLTSGASYYGGHGSGETSWGPIMGTGYNRNVTQWSKGEYYLANNTQDDLALLASKLSYIPDDHGNGLATASALEIDGTNIASTTPETDPTNMRTINKGVLHGNGDVDVFSFTTGPGEITLTVKPWVNASGMRGGNLDVSIELRDEFNELVATNNPDSQTSARIEAVVPQGKYFVVVGNAGIGSPVTASPSGYTSYGSIGQYFISGSIQSPDLVPVNVQITATPNNPEWGSVTPATATAVVGTTVQLAAIPAPFYEFVGWTNGAVGTENPLTLVVTDSTAVQAVFHERLTTNSPTPVWWLAEHGFNQPEAAVDDIGANGIAVWKSYVAGLDPTDPTDQLRVTIDRFPGIDVVHWNPRLGRTYNVLSSESIDGPYSFLPNGRNVPASATSMTNTAGIGSSRFYRVEVKLP